MHLGLSKNWWAVSMFMQRVFVDLLYSVLPTKEFGGHGDMASNQSGVVPSSRTVLKRDSLWCIDFESKFNSRLWDHEIDMATKKQVAPPPRKPWMLASTSSSSLRDMEIGLAPGQSLPPPSPNTLKAYEVKPLPPVPPRTSGSSQASTLHSKTGGALEIAEKDKKCYRETSIDGRQGPGLAVETQGVSANRRQLPHEKFQQQPMTERKSISKLYQVFGAGRALPLASITPAVPTGHNPRDKIKQLMGVAVATEQDQGATDVVEEVSPLTLNSDASSIYSPGVEAVVSPDTETIKAAKMGMTGFTEAETPRAETTTNEAVPAVIEDAMELDLAVSPTFKPWRHPSICPVPIPAHLNIVKSDSRSTSPTPPAPLPPATVPKHFLPEPHRTFGQTGKIYDAGDYHEALRELARSGPFTPSLRPLSISSSKISPRNTAYSKVKISSRPPTPRPPINKYRATYSNRSSSSRAEVAPPAKLELLKATTYKTPIMTPYPSDRPSTPDTPHPQTGRWLSRATNSDSKVRRPSLLNRVWNRLPGTVVEASTLKSTIGRPSGPGRSHTFKPPSRLHDRILQMDGGRRKKPTPVPLKPFSRTPDYGAMQERPLTPYADVDTNNNPKANRSHTPPAKLLSPLMETSHSQSRSHTPSHSTSSTRMTIDDVVHTPRAAPMPPTHSAVFETEETRMVEEGEAVDKDRTSMGTTVSAWAARTNELLGNRACEVLRIKTKAERRRNDLRGRIRVGMDGGQVGEEGEGRIGGKRFTGNLM